MPGETGVTVVTTLVCFLFFAREAAGANRAPGIPCALTLARDIVWQRLGRHSHRENGGACSFETMNPDSERLLWKILSLCYWSQGRAAAASYIRPINKKERP
jgi:hypothetical protein